jgi:glycosyltransferase involved in cell wall biosynthesis
MNLKITIITVCLNSRSTIESTFNSILFQKYKNIEHIVIDGGSKDGTIEFVQNWSHHRVYLIIKEKLGIYESMNLGINMSTGDIVGFLNSDDYFSDFNVVADIASVFNNKNIDSVFGDVVFVDPANLNKIVRTWNSGPYNIFSFKKGWQPAHPTFYLRKTLYLKYGFYDKNFKTAADFELLLRYFERYKITSKYIPRVLIIMRNGGISNKFSLNLLSSNFQNINAFSKNNIHINPYLYLLYRLLPKILNIIFFKFNSAKQLIFGKFF